MNEGQSKVRELGFKCVGNVLFIKANLLVQTFMCHDKYNFAMDLRNIKFILCEIIRSHEIKRERKKRRKNYTCFSTEMEY